MRPGYGEQYLHCLDHWPLGVSSLGFVYRVSQKKRTFLKFKVYKSIWLFWTTLDPSKGLYCAIWMIWTVGPFHTNLFVWLDHNCHMDLWIRNFRNFRNNSHYVASKIVTSVNHDLRVVCWTPAAAFKQSGSLYLNPCFGLLHSKIHHINRQKLWPPDLPTLKICTLQLK